MDFGLTEDENLIRDSVRRFVADQYDRERWTKVSRSGGFSADNWKALAELGYLGIGQPESLGGLGGPVEIALVCEEFGRGLLLEPYVATAIFAARLIAEAGSAEQQAALLPAIASGESLVAVAYSEPRSIGLPATTARKEGGDYILNGEKSLVLGGTVADKLIVTASVSDGTANAVGIALFLVGRSQAGVTVIPTPLVDGSWCAEVRLADVVVRHAQLLGDEGAGERPLREALRYAVLGVCGEMVGAIDSVVEIAADYIKTRKQFGVTISSFQALRHKMADMAIDREMARSTLLKLIASFQDPEHHDPAMTVAFAKALLGEIGRRVCSQAIQLHGGMGMTAECGVGRYFARANVISSLFGQSAEHLAAYTAMLADQVRGSARAA